MSALHILVVATVTVVGADGDAALGFEVSQLSQDLPNLLTDGSSASKLMLVQGYSDRQATLTKNWLIPVTLLVVLPLAMFVVLYIVAELLYGPGWWRNLIQERRQDDAAPKTVPKARPHDFVPKAAPHAGDAALHGAFGGLHTGLAQVASMPGSAHVASMPASTQDTSVRGFARSLSVSDMERGGRARSTDEEMLSTHESIAIARVQQLRNQRFSAPAASNHTSAQPQAQPPSGDLQGQPSSNAMPKAMPKAMPQPSAQALIVSSPRGVVLEVDDALVPHPQHRIVTFRSLKGYEIIRGHADELSGQPRVFIESASSIPLSVLDTKDAIYQAGTRPSMDRKVTIHRIVGPNWTIGQQCAVVKPAGPRQFTVHNLDRQESIVLSVWTRPEGQIEKMEDHDGCVVVRTPDMADMNCGIWVMKGVDMALIASVVLAVQKLA